MTEEQIIKEGCYFLSKFKQFNVMNNINKYIEIEKTIDEYSCFVSSIANEELWESLEYNEYLKNLTETLREESIICLQNFEKYKVLELSKDMHNMSDYFKGMEICIEVELNRLKITSSSKIMFIGAGAFPASCLSIAQKTGAEVFGIDIDSEAVRLARIVLSALGNTERITITDCPIGKLEFTKTASHIILASTVKSKFEILTQLHSLTSKEVVIAVRYGNGVKSLFNYPLKDVDETFWKLVHTVSIPKSLFDIAVYKKS
jgi:hypothetical protein